jgi:hypothetical protein
MLWLRDGFFLAEVFFATLFFGAFLFGAFFAAGFFFADFVFAGLVERFDPFVGFLRAVLAFTVFFLLVFFFVAMGAV